MKIRPAEKVHRETLNAREHIWHEFESSVAEQIEVAKAHGRFLVKLTVHKDVADAAPMVDKLKALGYTANLTTGDEVGILVSWRAFKTPLPVDYDTKA